MYVKKLCLIATECTLARHSACQAMQVALMPSLIIASWRMGCCSYQSRVGGTLRDMGSPRIEHARAPAVTRRFSHNIFVDYLKGGRVRARGTKTNLLRQQTWRLLSCS